MPGGIRWIDRFAIAITVRIEATQPERAPAVGLEEAHQYRAVGTVAIAQQVVVGGELGQFAVESQS